METRTGETAIRGREEVEKLATQMRGKLVLQDHDDYDTVRKIGTG